MKSFAKDGRKTFTDGDWVELPFITDEGIRLIQTAIAAYLDMETAKLDALVGKVEAAVERLREYRTALITAAVTGKIDVRMNANSIKP